MTYEEAKLKMIQSLPDDFFKDNTNREALSLMGIALEKQIPKKPINIRGAYFGKGKGGDCPNCKAGVNSIEYKYCRICGQALDWGG